MKSERGESLRGPTKKVAMGMPSGDNNPHRPRAQRCHVAETMAEGHRPQKPGIRARGVRLGQ